MMKFIAVHSSRGGTGKSLISVNLATIYALKGKNVLLLDLDFRAPSLGTVFRLSGSRYEKRWVNDFLDGRCGIEGVIMDLTEKLGTKGKFAVGLADPSIEAIRDMARRSRKWEMNALRRLLSLKESKVMNVDYMILDTSPGIQYSSVNAVVSSDITILVSTLDAIDIEGNGRMVKELYEPFGKRLAILFNKVPAEFMASKAEMDALLKEIKEKFPQTIIGMIPCYCDVLRTSRFIIFALEMPKHPFSRNLTELADKIEDLYLLH